MIVVICVHCNKVIYTIVSEETGVAYELCKECRSEKKETINGYPGR